MSSIAAGPWGGQSGYLWDDGIYSSVTQIVITTVLDPGKNPGQDFYGVTTTRSGIDSIQFEYDKNGRSIWSEKHGGMGGVKTDKIRFDHPVEFLISISGHFGPLREGDPVVVRSLSFESNRKRYGPFGIEQGMPFSLPISGGKLVGFHGRSSWYLDAIGVYVMPLMLNNPTQMQNLSHRQIGHGLDGKFAGSEVAYPIATYEPNKFLTENISNYEISNYTHKVSTDILSSKRVVSFGPWGTVSGTPFDDGIYSGVREVHITRSGGLVSIRVCYDQNGKTVWGEKNGGTGGLKSEKIVFDYPFELLTHISGYYGSTILRGATAVKSITFHTTKRSYGPFGEQQGFAFSSGTNGVVVGFHGRTGYFVNSIGVHVLEGKPLLSQPHPDPYDMSAMKYEVTWGVPREPSLHDTRPWGAAREPSLHDIGPWGGEGGQSWDDGVYTGVRKIRLTRSGEAICSIQIEYDRNGQSLWAVPHGSGNEACTHLIKFNYPYEVLTSISGYYDALFGDRHKMVVRSLAFQTNRAKYGPYGKEIGTHFSSAKIEGKVIGFQGRSGHFLDAIGVHMQCWSSDEISRHGNQTERGGIRNMLHRFMH